jgi:hypothetical protein
LEVLPEDDDAEGRDTLVLPESAPVGASLDNYATAAQVFQAALAERSPGPAVEAARRLLSHMEAACEDGRPVSSAAVATAALYGVRIADATRDASFIEQVIRIHSARAAVLPLEAIDALYELLRRVKLDVRALRDYLVVMEQNRAELTPAERFALRRTEGLLGLIRR